MEGIPHISNLAIQIVILLIADSKAAVLFSGALPSHTQREF